MIQNRKYLYTDVNGMEVRDDVAPLFDLVANDGDVHEYIADVVPSHWHSELEIFWLLEGRVRVGIGEGIRLLHQHGRDSFRGGAGRWAVPLSVVCL